MGTYRLKPHPAQPPRGIAAVDVRWTEFADGTLMLRWHVNGQDALRVPPFGGKGRGDRLWETTCFELFVKDAQGAGYAELNFSPSERWAAYRFTGYREGMAELAMEPPRITSATGDQLFVTTVTLDDAILAGASAVGLNAVIEEKCGRKSYWSLPHGTGEKPDFHDPACFALRLDAPDAP